MEVKPPIKVSMADVRKMVYELFTGLAVCTHCRAGEDCPGYRFTIAEAFSPPYHVALPVQGPVEYRAAHREITNEQMRGWVALIESGGVFKFVED